MTIRNRSPRSPAGTTRAAFAAALFAALVLQAGCSNEPPPPKGYGDGGGHATIVPDDPVPAGSGGSWEIVYVAGEKGIAPGGGVVVQFPVFWKWSPPQLFDPARPGYVEVRCSNPRAGLSAFASDLNWVRIGESQTAIVTGDTIRVRYGLPREQGGGLAFVDPYAERGQEFVVKVDGDGDEEFAEIARSPALDILPVEAAQLRIYLKGSAAGGDSSRLTVAALDRFGNRATSYRGTIRFSHRWNVAGLPTRYTFTEEDGGAKSFDTRFPDPGYVTVRVVEEGGVLECWSNPVLVHPRGEGRPPYQLLWSDIHQHSRYSDGTGEPLDLFTYARDVENLDLFCLTDHDHHGLRPLGEAEWSRISALTDSFYAPGEFVTLSSYEWTNWVYGHRNVYYVDTGEPLYSMADSATNSPEELWRALPTGRAMTIAHHTGGGPVQVDWSIRPDPAMEFLVEISSVHGSSEYHGCPKEIYNPKEGSFVRDALMRGYRLGFIGAGDGHIGHPGETYSVCGGLGGVYAGDRTRESVWEALRARRTYATSGERIVLAFRLYEHWMGEEVEAASLPDTLVFTVETCALAPVDAVELISDTGIVDAAYGTERKLEARFLVPRPDRPAWFYARVRQMDGGLAWSSPIWVDP